LKGPHCKEVRKMQALDFVLSFKKVNIKVVMFLALEKRNPTGQGIWPTNANLVASQ
jgi:hypothetical protein